MGVSGEDVEAWLARGGRALARRVERVGETAFCYAGDETRLLDDLRRQPRLQFLHRPANLEDVFLRPLMTGTPSGPWGLHLIALMLYAGGFSYLAMVAARRRMIR